MAQHDHDMSCDVTWHNMKWRDIYQTMQNQNAVLYPVTVFSRREFSWREGMWKSKSVR